MKAEVQGQTDPLRTVSSMEQKPSEMTVAFIGNPNCGKTTLFNAYTGANLKVANWPGVTVEKVEGAIDSHGVHIHLVDLPGTYSLTSYTMEEQVSRNFILSDQVDVIVDVVDASALERNLYLTLQLLELGKPVVVALNMMDIVEKRGMEIDLHRLPEMLGVPVIPVSALKRRGLSVLLHAAVHHRGHVRPDRLIHNHSDETKHRHNHHDEFAMVYSDALEDKIDAVRSMLHERYPDIYNHRWHALKLLEMDPEVTKNFPVDDPGHVIDRSYETDIINEKYNFIEEIIQEVVVNRAARAAATDYADKILTSNWLSIPVFLCIMAVVFFLTFFIGDMLKEYFEEAIDFLSQGAGGILAAAGAGDMVVSLVCDGIIAGVGGILTFLPNICILFFALALLEDSGYMSRVAYIMNDIMNKMGLSGRAFIPMILGFGCSVPAIMASRALENKEDRYRTMLVTPFMSCSARLLHLHFIFRHVFSEPCHAGGLLHVHHRHRRRPGIAASDQCDAQRHVGQRAAHRAARIQAAQQPDRGDLRMGKGKGLPQPSRYDYLRRVYYHVVYFKLWPERMRRYGLQLYSALIGRGLTPFFAPIGLGYWQITVALIAGISAKEVVVSSFAVLFDGLNINSTAAAWLALAATLGQSGFTALDGYCMMLFSLLYVPCAATIATIHAESQSWKWTAFSVAFQIFVAWIITFALYQIGSLVG